MVVSRSTDLKKKDDVIKGTEHLGEIACLLKDNAQGRLIKRYAVPEGS